MSHAACHELAPDLRLNSPGLSVFPDHLPTFLAVTRVPPGLLVPVVRAWPLCLLSALCTPWPLGVALVWLPVAFKLTASEARVTCASRRLPREC